MPLDLNQKKKRWKFSKDKFQEALFSNLFVVQTFPDRHLQLLDIDILTTKDKRPKLKKREIVITNQIKSKTHVTWILCTTGIPLKLMYEGNWMLLAVCVLLRQFLKVQLISKNKVYEIVVMLHYFFVAIHYFFT